MIGLNIKRLRRLARGGTRGGRRRKLGRITLRPFKGGIAAIRRWGFHPGPSATLRARRR